MKLKAQDNFLSLKYRHTCRLPHTNKATSRREGEHSWYPKHTISLIKVIPYMSLAQYIRYLRFDYYHCVDTSAD